MPRCSRTLIATLAVAGCLLGIAPAVATASTEGYGYRVFGYFAPTNLHPGSTAELYLYVYSVGAKQPNPTAVMVVDHLPAGWTVGSGSECKGEGTSVATCEIGAYSLPQKFRQGRPSAVGIPVNVPSDASSAVDRVEVTGGGAVGTVDYAVSATVAPGQAGFGISNMAAWATNTDGTTATQAGSHPYELTFAFALDQSVEGGLEHSAEGQLRGINVLAPPGIVGNPTAVPRCTRQQFEEGQERGCPVESMIGEDTARISEGEGQLTVPVYNLVPPKGVAAQFAFTLQTKNAFLDARVRSGGDYGITEHVDNAPEDHVLANSVTLWGVPGEASHDYARSASSQEYPEVGCLPGTPFAGPGSEEDEGAPACGSSAGLSPFLSLPTSCEGPREFSAQVSSWSDEALGSLVSTPMYGQGGEAVGTEGCGRLVHFEPTVSLAPDTSYADTPAGLTVEVKVPQGANPEGLATSDLKNTTVALPEGVVVNPGQATGLQACQSGKGPGTDDLPLSEAEDGEGEQWDGPPECPSASRVGTDEISTPLLPDKLVGSVYILQQNPPNLQLLVAASGDGVNLKLVGDVHLDETTGRLTTTFARTPDFPFTDFKLSFSGGAQAALVTPLTCGSYSSSIDFTPWSSPFVEDALETSSFQITGGPAGSPCVSPLPFAPVLTAGATTDQAGGYTSFSMLLQRGDGQQRIKSLSFKAPEGLSGMIASVPLCGEAQANAGTCPAASQIGHTVVGAGPGPFPLFIPQAGAPPAPIYLTGPYKGAPFGLSIVVPIVAGPFTLKTEVVRARIEVDPHTAQITVITDPLPTIVDGIPADLRSIDAVIDRPGFMFNPTNCSPMSFSGEATSTEGTNAAISSPFQVGSCQALKFKPDFTASTAGKASRADGASLTAKIVYPTAPLGANQASSQSNIASVKVSLPKQLPSRLTTLQKACIAAVFNTDPADCPAASAVGRAKVITPILPVPLQGPAYFVSNGSAGFPSLIVVLQGYGVTVDLVGDTSISKQGITSSTFKTTPDVPFSTFELTLGQGPYSALAANLPAKDHYDLCGQKLTMATTFTAQNGATVNQATPITIANCAKAKTKKKKPRSKRPSNAKEGKQR